MIGVALGTLVPSLVVKLFYQPRYVCRHLGISLWSYWRELGGVMLAVLLLQVPIAGVVWMVRPSSYIMQFGLALGLYSIHVVLTCVFILHPEDQQSLAAAVPALGVLANMRRRFTPAAVGGSKSG
jgi:hypothetical protein